jgi:hypothetical protein
MRILLDTHVFLGYISADPQLPVAFRQALRDPANAVYLSAASVLEAVIKHALEKLPLPEAPAEYMPRQREAHDIAPLAIDEAAYAPWPACQPCIATRRHGGEPGAHFQLCRCGHTCDEHDSRKPGACLADDCDGWTWRDAGIAVGERRER